jgi:hypothetical protein
MTAVDLRYHELVLLLQLVNVRMVQQAREQQAQGVPACEIATPVEVALFDKLYAAQMEEMELIKEAAGDPSIQYTRSE